MPCQAMIAWIENSDVKLKFLEIIEIFEADLLQLRSTLTESSSILTNFKNRCILCDVCSTHVFTIIHVDTFHGSKGDFPITCVVTSFKTGNHYIVASLTFVVHSAEDCCTSSMKLGVYTYYIYIYIYIYTYLLCFTAFQSSIK